MRVFSLTPFAAAAVLITCLAVLHRPCTAGDPKSESKKYFQKGISLYNQGAIEEALGQFHKAFVAFPHWKIRKNIGLCYMQLGDNVLALQELYTYLDEGKSELSEKEKQTVMNVIFEVLEKVGIIRFTMLPSDTTKIVIDGQPSPDAGYGKDVYVEPGLHVISVLNDKDELLYREEVTINAGDQKEIDVGASVSTYKSSPEETSQIPTWQEVGPPKKKKNLKVLHPAVFGVAVSLSVASLGTLIGTGIKAFMINKDYKNTSSTEKQDDLKAEGQKYQLLTNAFVGVAAGFAAVSLVLFFFTDFSKGKKKETEPVLTFMPQLGPSSAALGLRLMY